MIDISQSRLLSMLICSLVCGIVAGLFYELIRFTRILLGGAESGDIIKKCRFMSINKIGISIFTFCSDLIFLVLFASCALLLTYKMSGGVFRGMVYSGMLVGLLLYKSTLGRIILKLDMKISGVIRRLFKRVFVILAIPIRWIFLAFVKLYGLTIGKIIDKIIDGITRIKMKNNDTEDSADISNALLDGEKEKINEQENHGYRREDRISFIGRKNDIRKS